MKLNISVKILIPIVLLNLIVFCVHIFFTTRVLETTILGQLQSKGLAIGKALSTSVQETILNRDASTIQGYIDDYKNLNDIAYIFIIDEEKRIISHTFSPYFPGELKAKLKSGVSEEVVVTTFDVKDETILNIELPILSGLIGRVYLGMALGKVQKQIIQPILWESIVRDFIITSIGIIVVVFMIIYLLGPIRQLNAIVKRIITTNDLNYRIPVKTEDEVGRLGESFNNMLQSLKEYQEDLELKVEDRTKIIEAQQMHLAESARLSSLGEMGAGIAHEINNPLAIISANIRMLEIANSKGKLTPEFIEKTVDVIRSTIVRAEKIIKGLRNMSRVSSGNEMRFVPIRVIFEDVKSLCVAKFKNRSIQIDFDDESFEDIELNCDQVQLSQVFLNLINNAADAVEELDDKWVRVSVFSEKEKLNVMFVDSGFGISDEIAEKIFSPFFTSKEVGKGTGIGLSISKNIIDQHGANISYRKHGGHTAFVIQFEEGSYKS